LLPFIILLLLPSLLILSHFIFLKIRDYYRDNTIFHIKNSPASTAIEIYRQNFLYAKLAESITTYFQYGLIFIIIIIYPFYPFIFSKDNYFKRRGFENVVIEYQHIKKIFHISLLPFIISLFFYITIIILSIKSALPFIANSDIIFILLSVIVMGAGVLFKELCFFLKKEFRYYFAKGCFRIATTEEDEGKKLTYLDLMLDSYNKYLERTIKIKIKDLDKIYQNIIFVYINRKNECILSSIKKAIEGNKLDLFQYILATFLKTSDIDQFLIKVSSKYLFIKKLKQVGSFFVVAIPIAISIITLYLSMNKPH
jgi:hypothetical protein